MYKLYTYILVASALFFINARVAYAENINADASASLAINNVNKTFDFRVATLRNFLNKYNSPLAEYAEEFVMYADNYGLDYRLIPSITGVESTFGIHIPKNSFNAYGWANGEYSFRSWEDSIEHVSKTLKFKYIDSGANSIKEIARIYAPPSSTWAGKVSFFVKKIDTIPLTYDL